MGCGFEEYSEGLRRGECGLRPIEEFDPGEIALEVAGEVKDLPRHVPPGVERHGRFTRLAVAGAHQAVQHAGISFDDLAPCDGLLMLATAMGPCDVIEEHMSNGVDGVPLGLMTQQLFSFVLNAVSDELGFSGEATLFTHGCSAANYSLTYARDRIAQGVFDVALVGGVDTLVRNVLSSYDRFGILASRARPFDANCEGMTVGEGAGFVVLETPERAAERGAQVFAEIAGGATTIDAYQTLSPSPEGQALYQSMAAALEQSGLGPAAVDYISASAPGTPLGDRAEARAIRKLFEPTGKVPPVSATKSQTGNCHGASAMLEAIACMAAITEGFLPPTIGLEQPNEDATFDLVANHSRDQAVSVALNNATGFGGADSSVVIKRYREA